MQLRTLRFVLYKIKSRNLVCTCLVEKTTTIDRTSRITVGTLVGGKSAALLRKPNQSGWCTSFTTPSYLKSEEKVPEDILVERVVGRRLGPVTGKIYHLKYSPPETEEIAARLTQRLDDTEEKVRLIYVSVFLESFPFNHYCVALSKQLQQRETLLQFHF
ncbi:unnamed protein product [Brassica rapa subsp. trilocularis]